MAAIHRIRQGIRALFAFTQKVEYQLVEIYLSPKQLALFKKMQHSEQLHGINVLRDVLAQDKNASYELAVAALLHDVGKYRYSLAVWQKTFGVLLKKFIPSLFNRWSKEDVEYANPFKLPCIVMIQHPEWGTKLVSETEAQKETLWLIAHHADNITQWHGHPNIELLKRLQYADNLN